MCMLVYNRVSVVLYYHDYEDLYDVIFILQRLGWTADMGVEYCIPSTWMSRGGGGGVEGVRGRGAGSRVYTLRPLWLIDLFKRWKCPKHNQRGRKKHINKKTLDLGLYLWKSKWGRLKKHFGKNSWKANEGDEIKNFDLFFKKLMRAMKKQAKEPPAGLMFFISWKLNELRMWRGILFFFGNWQPPNVRVWLKKTYVSL